MNYAVIRYQTKPEALEQNCNLIQDVFRELAATKPEGVNYCAVRTEDGAFFHIVSYEKEGDQNKISGLKAFAAFQDGSGERRIAPPEFNDVTIVGNYGLLPE
jgi:hypothetical protein